MTRTRSRSVVQRIAQDVAVHNENLPVLNEPQSSLTSPSSSSSSSSSKKNSRGEEQVIIDKNNHKNNHKKNDQLTTPLKGGHHLKPLHRNVGYDSYDNLSIPSSNIEKHNSPLYPFTTIEEVQLWSKYTSEYSHDIVIPNSKIEAIQALEDDLVLVYLDKCKQNIESIDDLIKQTDMITDHLSQLSMKYNTVSNETSDFANKSQQLMEKQLNLKSIADEIGQNLLVFEVLDSITKLLTSPGLNIVRKQSFHESLLKLDSCLAFIDQHDSYKEADTYRVRFRQCMTRSLTLIRNYLIEDLKEFQKRITTKLSSTLNTKSGIYAFNFDIYLYAEFNDHLKTKDSNEYYSFPRLVSEIYKRTEAHQEYMGLYNDVESQYFRFRSTLLNDYIWNHIDQAELKFLNDDSINLVQFAQDNISFYKKILIKEKDLHSNYFNGSTLSSLKPNPNLNEWFKSILEPLYDTLRNRIIRETNISVLCELTTLLQKYYEFDDNASDGGSYNGGSAIYSMKGSDSMGPYINFANLFEPILNDVQRRLIFRIQLYVDDKLMKYKATPEDLKLGQRARSNSVDRQKKISPLNGEFPENMFEDWFLPIGKALTLLSKIYELVNSVVFDDLAHYIVHSCIYILKNNAYPIAESHLGKNNAKLYLLKNLILLQEQLGNFDIQYVRTETSLDFTSGINEIFEIVKASKMQSLNVLELLRKSVPKVVNNMIDAKREAQTELSNLVADFVESVVKELEAPLDSSKSLESSLAFRDKLTSELPKTQKEINQYLSDQQVSLYLVSGIKTLLLSSYEEFYQQALQKSEKSGDKNKQMSEIMEPDTFFGFLDEVIE